MHRDPCHEICEVSASGTGFPPYLLEHRQRPNCKLLCGATEVRAQDTWFVHRSDSPVLTFWRLGFSLDEHDVALKDLQQPSVGLFLIRAGPSRMLQLRQT